MQLDPIELFRSASSHVVGKLFAVWFACGIGGVVPEAINMVGRTWFEEGHVMQLDRIIGGLLGGPFYLFAHAGPGFEWTVVGLIALFAIGILTVLYIREENLVYPLGWMALFSMICTIRQSGDYLVCAVIIASLLAGWLVRVVLSACRGIHHRHHQTR
jgi:hypothetical protein